MICPKCEEEKIVKVTLKKNQEKAYLCQSCGTIWLENEDIKLTTGHTYDVLTRGDEFEYTLENEEEKDQEHRDPGDAPYT